MIFNMSARLGFTKKVLPRMHEFYPSTVDLGNIFLRSPVFQPVVPILHKS